MKEDAQTCSQILDELCEDPNVQIVQEVLDLRGHWKKENNMQAAQAFQAFQSMVA